VVPFYWGFSEEESKINKHEVHGQWTERYGNRLDQNGSKNGGPFANATSDLNAMWAMGSTAKSCTWRAVPASPAARCTT
jgi:hypothetical protein